MCSRVGGGGDSGLTALLFSVLLFSALALRYLLLAISSMDVDEIKNTQKNDNMGKE
jgi:hypothetical protein